MNQVRQTLLRAVCLAVILFAAMAPTTAQATTPQSMDRCAVCTGNTECPVDLGAWDQTCKNLCGPSTYAGACAEGESQFLCAAILMEVVCYLAQE